MKTSVVPAQITTVEDKIAGNMTFSQILMLVIPLVCGTIAYLLIPPRSHLSIAKLVMIVTQFLIFGLLAIRFRGRTVADWLVIFLRFNLRPHLYVFTKNDLSTRDVVMEEEEKKTAREKKNRSEKKNSLVQPQIDRSLLNRLLADPSLAIRLQFGKKGGVHVSLNTDKS